MITVVVSPEQFQRDELELAGVQFRHLFRARRLASESKVRLVDGRGAARSGRVVDVSKNRARIEMAAALPSNEPAVQVHLLAPLPRPSRQTWMVEKCTELGIHAVHLFQSRRAPRSLGAASRARLGRVAEAAVEQCHRALVPEVTGPHAWSDLGSLLVVATQRWVLVPGAKSRLPRPATEASALVVGPEGGFVEAELADLEQWGCMQAGLGPSVLRIETAAVAASALSLV